MTPSISVADFVDPKRGSRAWNAVTRAIELAPTTNVELIGEIRGERYYRVRAKGRDRHCIIRWFSQLSQEELASCDCPAFTVPVSGPTHCWHVGAVLIFEASQTERKLASMGSQKRNGSSAITA